MTEHLSRRKFLVSGSATLGTSLLLQSCGGAPTTQASPTGQNLLAASKGLKVASVYTVPVEQPWVSRIHQALEAAQGRGDIQYSFSESVANPDYERVLRQYAEAGNQLIIGQAFAAETACRQVARTYPKTAFLMGSSGKPDGANFSVFDNYIHEPAYLTGMIAGGMTQSNTIGLVAGYAIPEVNRLMHAFMDGARETNSTVKFLVTFISSWFDPPKAREAALAQISAGADVMYAERFGVADAAKQKKVLAIGNVTDTQADYPDTIVVSALWHMEPTIDQAIKAVREGTFKAEDYGQYSYMKHGGSSLSTFGKFEDKIPTDLKAKVKQRQEEMMTGKFTVKINNAEPKTT